MSHFKTWRIFRKGFQTSSRWRLALVIFVAYLFLSTLIRSIVPPPAAVGLSGFEHRTDSARFLYDDSWVDSSGQRQLSQHIFDEILTMIGQAERFVLLDMFLFNGWQGPVAETHRAISAELTQALIAQKRAYPELDIIVITDPINTVYGGLPSIHLGNMNDAGISTVLSRLDRLQDSNPLWSGFWRIALAPFGNSPGSLLPNPFGDGRVSLRSYFTLLNFKANHRKLVITDLKGGELQGLVSSANPHDGSSAHRNVALRFSGAAVFDLLKSEHALLMMSDAGQAAELAMQERSRLTTLTGIDEQMATTAAGPTAETPDKVEGLGAQSLMPDQSDGLYTAQILSESRIHEVVSTSLASAQTGDAVDLAMFYLSERGIVTALKQARARGAEVRVLLDVNNDAFGRAKNGVPNRPVAAELVRAGITVRWCATKGEQCHAKWLHTRINGKHSYLLGSANYTRRNLMDLNMETNVRITATTDSTLVADMADFFARQWHNTDSRTYSEPYERYADDSLLLTLQYRFMEATGLSTF